MSEKVLLQIVVNQRGQQPDGKRVLADGTYQITAPDNAMPGPDELLEKERMLSWQTIRQLSESEMHTLEDGIRQSGILDLPPRILINYCKEDPGTQIWAIELNEHKRRVVLYDPKPRRSAEIDAMSRIVAAVLGA